MADRLDEVRAHVEDIERWSKDCPEWHQSHEPERIAADMRWLLDEVERERRAMQAGAGSRGTVLRIAERIADADSEREASRLLVVLIDGVEVWRMVR